MTKKINKFRVPWEPRFKRELEELNTDQIETLLQYLNKQRALLDIQREDSEVVYQISVVRGKQRLAIDKKREKESLGEVTKNKSPSGLSDKLLSELHKGKKV